MWIIVRNKKIFFFTNALLFQDAEFIERNLDVLLELMISSLPCQFPSKRYRLECLHHLIVYILKVGKKNSCHNFLTNVHTVSGRVVTRTLHFLGLQDSSKLRKREIVSWFLTEILLALKEVIETVYYSLHGIFIITRNNLSIMLKQHVADLTFFVSNSLWNASYC